MSSAYRVCLLSASVLLLPAPPRAIAQLSENVIFHSRLDVRSQYSDIWGYTAGNGDEYALVGTTKGLSVVNIVDPKNPYETGFVSGPVSTWRSST